MTNEEILNKSIEKAQANGFKPKYFPDGWGLVDEYEMSSTYRLLIFSHDFAKAFWGEEELGWFTGYNEWGTIKESDLHEDSDLTPLRLKMWQYHLQQMVLEEDPIKYLEQFLDK